MKKKLLAITLAITVITTAISAQATNLTERFPQNIAPITFVDVTSSDWYYESVSLVQEAGILTGITDAYFDPRASVTTDQAVTVAARLHQTYYGAAPIVPAEGLDWSTPYWHYAQSNGLLNDDWESWVGKVCPRSFFVQLVANVFPVSDFTAINQIEALPDVGASTPGRKDILMLYNAGILTGVDKHGTFGDGVSISRAEIATIVGRIIRPEMRVSFQPDTAPSTYTLSKINVPAQFFPAKFDGTYLYGFGRSADNQYEYAVLDLQGEKIATTEKGQLEPIQNGVFLNKRGSANDGVVSDGVVYYTETGTQINSTPYAAGTQFCNGVAVTQAEWGGAFTLINQEGKAVRVLPNPNKLMGPRALTSTSFTAGTADGEYLIDIATGVAKLLPASIVNFSEGLAAVIDYKGSAGYVDQGGNWSIRGNYTLLNDFSQGVAVVGNSRYGVIDKTGTIILPMEYKTLTNFSTSGYAVGSKQVNGVWNNVVIDKSGTVITTLTNEPDSSFEIGGSFILQHIGDSKSLLDINGNSITIGVTPSDIILSDTGAIVCIGDDCYIVKG